MSLLLLFHGSGAAAAAVPVVRSLAQPPLALHAEVVAPDGTSWRWGAESRKAADVPRGTQFSTKLMEGFERSSCHLLRRFDLDFHDLQLYHQLNLIGYDGSVAYEGRIQSMPRSSPNTIQVEANGWMAHARDRKFREIYIDREIQAWGAMSIAQKAGLISSSLSPHDPTNFNSTVATTFDGTWTAASKPFAAATYSSDGIAIGSLYYAWERNANVNDADGNWSWEARLDSDEDFAAGTFDTTGNLRAAGPGSGTLNAGGDDRTFAQVTLSYNSGPAGTDGVHYAVYWVPMAVYGDHGLTKRGDSPQGFYASDVIRHIAQNWCPMLRTDGIQDTFYPIPQLTFKDRTDPYDGFLAANAPHLWMLAVWEDRTLHYGPHDLTDYDWQVSTHDPRVQVELQGDSTDELANYCVVQFQNVLTGRQDEVSPDTHSELRDDTVDHPANRAGFDVELGITLSAPADEDYAAQIGRMALAENNQPKAPGTITVKGHIRDRAGHWQQGWKVRAGETVAIVSHPNDRPRLITETSWDHESKTLTISTDSTTKRLDAFLDRLGTQLRARNLAT